MIICIGKLALVRIPVFWEDKLLMSKENQMPNVLMEKDLKDLPIPSIVPVPKKIMNATLDL